jgi:hypothetical protein
MRRYIRYARVLALVFTIFLPGLSHAITITAPGTVEVGQPVTITVSGVPSAVPAAGATCFLTLDYGDATSADASLVNCTAAGAPCSRTVTHTYRNPGTYTIRAGNIGCVPGAFQPNSAVRTIKVVDLKIQRLDIFLNNHLPKMTVNQYQRDLKAFAEIRYTGAGLLQGQWEIDGRIFSRVTKQLYQGLQKVTIQTPLAPPLPTYAVGTHRVSFVITRPEPALAVPQAIYFVKAETEQFDIPIRLSEPPDNRSTACTPFTLRWEAAGKAYVYLVEFIAADGSDPIFSAYAKEPAYTLRADLCRSLSKAGHAYHWRVKALSQEGQVIGESAPNTLFLESGEQ